MFFVIYRLHSFFDNSIQPSQKIQSFVLKVVPVKKMQPEIEFCQFFISFHYLLSFEATIVGIKRNKDT